MIDFSISATSREKRMGERNGVDYYFLKPDEFRKKIQPDYVIGAVHLIKKEGIDALWFIDGPENNYHEGLIKIFNGDIRLAVTTYYNQLCEM